MKHTIIKCNTCQTDFFKLNKEIKRCQKKGIRGHFCSRSCVATFRNKKMSPEFWTEQYKNNPNFEGLEGNRQDEYSSFKPFLNKGRATFKKHKCTINLQYLKEQWEIQKGICPYTNIKMILPRNTLEYTTTKSLIKASLDRIDSTKDYIPGNVEFVCCGINLAKNNFSKKTMVDFISTIVLGGGREGQINP